MKKKKVFLLTIMLYLISIGSASHAQNYVWISSTEKEVWKESKIRLQPRVSEMSDLHVADTADAITFKAWGTTFNELCWDALNILTRDEQDAILKDMFSPGGDLRFTRGRIAMNANDYARGWYSCDEVAGDFRLKYFNIERDKSAIIPYIRAAQKYNPQMTFWISPWSPPSWMKINNDYPVRSDATNHMDPKSDIALFEETTNKQQGVFPQRLAVNDYMIQDPRYLQAYADMFCKFIDAYKEQGIPITMVMYQNEAYSYTPYPGCAWTAEGTIRFNMEYLAPTLQRHHPEVDLYIGTFNTNRFDHVDQILSDPRMAQSVKGVGFQWEGGQILSKVRSKYPQWRYVMTESECGSGTFDWKAAEHTFHLINHYLGNGCEEYTFWNGILCDSGISPWGWKQNALIRIDTQTRKAIYTPEYYAVKHYTHYITPGTKILSYEASTKNGMPILMALTPQNKHLIIIGNFNNATKIQTVKIGNRYLNVELQPHSFNTFIEK